MKSISQNDSYAWLSKYAVLFLYLGLSQAITNPVSACVTVSQQANNSVQIVDEEAIIVWDAKTQTEHFIRRASFNSPVRDFGFLVPSPSIPQLAEVDNNAFAVLENTIKPEIIHHKNPHFYFSLLRLSGSSDDETTETTSNASNGVDENESVSVLSQQRVAGYDSTVLSADNASALNRWLKRNGYVSGRSFEAWLQPYIVNHWNITAFKIAKTDKTESQAISGTVRMSFHTVHPFFPYHEPSDQRSPQQHRQSRSLRVFFLGHERVIGHIGTAKTKHWPGYVKWTNTVESQKIETLPALLKLEPQQVPDKQWLTAFEDWSSPRPGTDDLFFKSSLDQSPVVPLPLVSQEDVDVYIPLDLMVVALIIGGPLLWMWKRKRDNAV